ncbi:DoxX-like family protein [Niastella sp. OAS944]|uniref:DoxX-like family protein n=1 Tax=Niastella sp. OAS944 TaxID=2664089 RepID=UPI0035C7B3B7
MIINKLLNYCIAAIWLVNGLFCKVLNLVPRHQQIVARILGEQYATVFTKAIGFAEIGMAAWVVAALWPRLNAVTQIVIIAVMNCAGIYTCARSAFVGKAKFTICLHVHTCYMV